MSLDQPARLANPRRTTLASVRSYEEHAALASRETDDQTPAAEQDERRAS